MSNPAVITLSKNIFSFKEKIVKKLFSKNKRPTIKVEDNIGESIHIHYDQIRIDLTIREFEVLCKNIEAMIVGYLHEINPELNKIPISFLVQISSNINKIKEIRKEKRRLSDLKIIENIDHLTMTSKLVKLKESMIVKALNGEPGEYYNYKQRDDFFESNEVKLSNLNESIVKNGFKTDISSVVVFSSDPNIIRDGQHRCAIMYALNPNTTIEVLNISFLKNVQRYRTTSQFFKNFTYKIIKYTGLLAQILKNK